MVVQAFATVEIGVTPFAEYGEVFEMRVLPAMVIVGVVMNLKSFP